MDNLTHQIDLLQKCEQECTLISLFGTDQNTRAHHKELAEDYRMIVNGLKSFNAPPLEA